MPKLVDFNILPCSFYSVYPTIQVLLLSTRFSFWPLLYRTVTLGFVSTALPELRYAITEIPLKYLEPGHHH